MGITIIRPRELSERIEQQGAAVQLIDVRTAVEFRAVHVPQARNIPLDEFDPAAIAAARPTIDTPIYLICASGARAQKAGHQLVKAGVANVINIEGGTNAWVAEQLPVACGKKAISLERQVRIAAGSLVLTGAVLAWLVHPAFIGLSGFVGAGLIFAGITDTCGMGLLLARMPWNKVSAAGEPVTACQIN